LFSQTKGRHPILEIQSYKTKVNGLEFKIQIRHKEEVFNSEHH